MSADEVAGLIRVLIEALRALAAAGRAEAACRIAARARSRCAGAARAWPRL